MTTEESKSKSEWVGQIKWIVFGIITLTVLFLFKEEIKQLLQRTENIEISASGLKIKTTQTLLGKAEVSNVTLTASDVHGEGLQAGSYINHNHKFQISWPNNSDWSASDTMGKPLAEQLGLPPTIEIPVIILKNEFVENFRPNVNVVVESIGGAMSARSYIDSTVITLQQQGFEILSVDIDDDTQGGFISFYNNNQGMKLYQFQRIAIAHNNAYVITASQLPPEDSLSQSLKEELLSILNSFRILV